MSEANPSPTRLSELIGGMVAQSLDIKARFFADNASRLAEVAQVLAHGFRTDRKVLLFGNGGSAADAQHIAAELVGRFVPERPALPALSLSTDTSVLSSVANDYGFDHIFARQIEALGRPGDTVIAISTSGNSPNVLAGIAAARSKGMYTIGFTGESGGKMAEQVEVLFRVPTRYTPRIQETHIMIGHVFCELVDRLMLPELYPEYSSWNHSIRSIRWTSTKFRLTRLTRGKAKCMPVCSANRWMVRRTCSHSCRNFHRLSAAKICAI